MLMSRLSLPHLPPPSLAIVCSQLDLSLCTVRVLEATCSLDAMAGSMGSGDSRAKRSTNEDSSAGKDTGDDLVGTKIPANAFLLSSPHKSLVIVAPSEAERDIWLNDISKSIEDLGSTFYGKKRALDFDDLKDIVGNAAILKPYSSAKFCYVCSAKFSLLRTKHHCRKCGNVVCNRCSTRRVPVSVLEGGVGSRGKSEGGTARICDNCCRVVGAFGKDAVNASRLAGFLMMRKGKHRKTWKRYFIIAKQLEDSRRVIEYRETEFSPAKGYISFTGFVFPPLNALHLAKCVCIAVVRLAHAMHTWRQHILRSCMNKSPPTHHLTRRRSTIISHHDILTPHPVWASGPSPLNLGCSSCSRRT